MSQVHLRLGSGWGVAIFIDFIHFFGCNFPSFSLAIDCLVGRSFFFKCTRRYLLIWEILCQAFPELSLRISRMLKAGQLSLSFFDVKFSLFSSEQNAIFLAFGSFGTEHCEAPSKRL